MMEINLYPCFKHFKKYKEIWLYADPHFNDEQMNCSRQDYIGDDEQVKRINSKVEKKDIIIFLGDIGDVSFIKKVRGYKILVLGNHDKSRNYYQKGRRDKKHLFDEVYSGIVTLNEKIVLSHEPIAMSYMFNIHGHDHNHVMSFNDELHLNLCAEHIDYTPVSLTRLMKKGFFKSVPNIHKETIKKATEKKIQRQIDKWDSDRPKWNKIFVSKDNLPSKVYEDGYECRCFGYITYKGCIYPVYDDDYGCQHFIIYRYWNDNGEIAEYDIPVENMGGMLDWWFELNRMKDLWPDEVVLNPEDIGI